MIQANPKIEQYRLTKYSSKEHGNNGAFIVPFTSFRLRVVASDGMGWDHVSVSLKNRCPNWAEMCFIKDLFFDPEETVVQFHPRYTEYVNNHPHCLHMWRKQDLEYELPPSILVGIIKGGNYDSK